MKIRIVELRWTFANLLLLSVINCFGIQVNSAQVIISTPPENTTVCRGSDVTITCRYVTTSVLPVTWIINGTSFTQEEILNSPLYQLNNPTIPTTLSLTVFSINGTTTFQCVVLSTPITTSTRGTVTVNNATNVTTSTTSTTDTTTSTTDITTSTSTTDTTTSTTDTTTSASTTDTTTSTSTTDTTTSTSTIDITSNITNNTTNNNTNTTTNPIVINTTTVVMDTTSFTVTDSVAIITSTVDSNVPKSTVKDTNLPNTTNESGSSSTGAVVGGVIGGIVIVIVIVIIIVVMYYFIFYRNKDNDDGKSPYYSTIASNRNGKNTLAVSNSVTYDEVHKTEAKTVPHQTTETGELYAMSTKVAYQDTHDEPSMLYTYARVDLDTKRKITEASVPHQTAADVAQYAVSTKAAAKDDRATDNDVNQNTENKEIKYADLQPLPTSPEMSNVGNESSSQYTQIAT